MIDLTPFCSTEPSRPYIHKPWSRGEYTYATDGHIAVRVARRNGVPDHDQAPNCERVLPSHDGVTFRALTAAITTPKPETYDCTVCDGSGKEHDCDNCTHECGECDGRGYVEKVVAVRLRGAVFDARLVNLLASLPSIELPDKILGDVAYPVPFRFDGGIGAVMRMRLDHRFDFDAGDA